MSLHDRKIDQVIRLQNLLGNLHIYSPCTLSYIFVFLKIKEFYSIFLGNIIVSIDSEGSLRIITDPRTLHNGNIPEALLLKILDYFCDDLNVCCGTGIRSCCNNKIWL